MSAPNPTALFQPAALPEPLLDLFETLQLAVAKPSGPKAALAIIEEYHKAFDPSEMRRDMWLLYSAATCNQHMPALRDTEARHHLLFFYEFTLMLLDAVYLLHGREGLGKLK